MKYFYVTLCLVLQSIFIQAQEPSPRVAYSVQAPSEKEPCCLPRIWQQGDRGKVVICSAVLLIGAAALLASNVIKFPHGSNGSTNSTMPLPINNQTALPNKHHVMTLRTTSSLRTRLSKISARAHPQRWPKKGKERYR